MIQYNLQVLGQYFRTSTNLPTPHSFAHIEEYQEYPTSNPTLYDKKASDIIINSTQTYIYEIPGLGKLKKPLLLHVEINEYGFTIKSLDLEIVESGEDAESALKEFFNFFIEDYENWLRATDDDLTEKAARLKQKYLDYVS